MNCTLVVLPVIRLLKNPVPFTITVDPPAADPVAEPEAVVTLMTVGMTGL
jgi:hypothetical protein